MDRLLIVVGALLAPLFLMPVESILPYPYIIEETIKLLLLLPIVKKPRFVTMAIVIGVCFALSESMFYLINLFQLGNVGLFPMRLLATGLLHSGTTFIMALCAKKGTTGLFIGFLLAVAVHYIYNVYASALYLAK